MPLSGLQLRPVEPSDREFLLEVYSSTRPDVTLAGLDPQSLSEFLEMQFQAQDSFYREAFADAEYSVVMLDGESIGRLYLDRRPDEFRILDIALLDPYRSRGLGTILVKQVIEEAHRNGLPVRIHVEMNSREIGFYERIGFQKIGEIPTHQLMELAVEKIANN